MSTTASGHEWQPLTSVDYLVLGFVGTLQLAAFLVCVHLIWYRKWPPYVTKNVNLVVIATLSGILWTGSMTIASGMWKREAGDVLAACDFERFLSWSTLCVHTVTFFIRVYRMWRILIKHDKHMWHTEHQILLMSSVSLIPVIITWLIPDTGHFDEARNTCYTTGLSALVTVGMDCIGLSAIAFLWFVCARQLKTVRRQFNEHDTMKKTLLSMTVVLCSYPVIVLYVLADKQTIERRVSIFYPLLTTYILLWGSIREPFMKKMIGDQEYLLSYTKGFATMPSPAQLKASLAEQLSVEQLRTEFRRYIKTRVAQELIDFYLDSLDREEVMGFFERQAVTMRIVERYIREGAPDEVNISEECRERLLATDVTAYDIFDEARAEVLAVMETNFRREFVSTEGFKRLLDASEKEEREILLLRARGMLLPGTPPTPVSSSQRTKSARLIPSLTAPFRHLPSLKTLLGGGRARGGGTPGTDVGEGGGVVTSMGRASGEQERDGGHGESVAVSVNDHVSHRRSSQTSRSSRTSKTVNRSVHPNEGNALSRAIARSAEMTGRSHAMGVEVVDACGADVYIENEARPSWPQVGARAAGDGRRSRRSRPQSASSREQLVDAAGADHHYPGAVSVHEVENAIHRGRSGDGAGMGKLRTDRTRSQRPRPQPTSSVARLEDAWGAHHSFALVGGDDVDNAVHRGRNRERAGMGKVGVDGTQSQRPRPQPASSVEQLVNAWGAHHHTIVVDGYDVENSIDRDQGGDGAGMGVEASSSVEQLVDAWGAHHTGVTLGHTEVGSALHMSGGDTE